jgi:hypothetical protein
MSWPALAEIPLNFFLRFIWERSLARQNNISGDQARNFPYKRNDPCAYRMAKLQAEDWSLKGMANLTVWNSATSFSRIQDGVYTLYQGQTALFTRKQLWVNPCNQPEMLWNFFYIFRYVPPLLWGKNGHLHTFVFSKLSPKIECKATRQHSVKLEDNSTVIFDIFEPCPDEKSEVGKQRQLLLRRLRVVVICEKIGVGAVVPALVIGRGLRWCKRFPISFSN